jgi:hypothetical protein
LRKAFREQQGKSLLLPPYLDPEKPLYLNRAATRRVRLNYDSHGIFLNIPYSKKYAAFELAIVSTVTAYDLVPRLARWRGHMEVRLLKIAELILTCEYAVTDLSYVARMNMPFELGILLAFGKETFVMSNREYGALKSISDLNFSDIYYHGNRIRKLIVGLSRWIEQNCCQKRLTTLTLLHRYRRLRQIRRSLGDDFDRLGPDGIARFLGVVRDEYRMILPGSSKAYQGNSE